MTTVRLYEVLYEEYLQNELLHENYTFDEVLDLYEERKQTTSLSFNNFIQWKIEKWQNWEKKQ